MPQINSFRDFEVYQISLQESTAVYEWSLELPKTERYGLASQIRRSSRAVGGLIAEAWGRRRYENAFIEKLTQALAEAKETQALNPARAQRLLDDDKYEVFDGEWNHICAMIRRMIQRADRFCRTK